jgi:hypothetical protein
MPSPTLAKSEDKQSDSLSHDSETELAGEQSAQGARAGLPEFLRQIYGPANIEDGMSEEEKQARGVALVAAVQIEISLGDALQSVHDARLASSRSAAGTAAAAKRAIHLHAQKEKDKYEQVWEAQDIAVKSAILAEYDSLRDDYAARQSEAHQRVDISTTGIDTLFSEHQSNLDRAAQEGGADCETARIQNRNKIMEDFYDSESQVGDIGSSVRNSFGETERDDEMREGVRWVEGKIKQEMDDRLEEAQTAIDNFFLQQSSTDPSYAFLPESSRPKVSMQSIIAASSKKADVGFGEHKQEILDQIEETGPVALDSLESIFTGESSFLDELQQSAPDQLLKLKDTAFSRMDHLAQSACDQIDHALPIAQSTLARVEATVRHRIEPLGKKATELLRADVPPEEQESRDVTSDLTKYFEASSEYAAKGMADGAAKTSMSFLLLARQTETALTAESTQAAQYTADLGTEICDQIDKMQQQRMQQMQSSCDELNEVLDDCDRQFIDKFTSMVESFRSQIRATIASMNSKIDEAMQEAKNKNLEAIGTVRAAMQAEAEDRGYKYDHPVRHALWVGLQSGWAFIKATAKIIATVVAALIIAFVAVLVLVLLGIELAVAEAIVAIAMLGYMAYQAVKAYHARKAKGQSEFNAIFGSIGDVTGISDIYHGFTDEYLTMPERVEKITGGTENLALLVFGSEINKGVGDLLKTDAPWIDEPPMPSAPSAAAEVPSAPADAISEGAGNTAAKAWEPPPLKQTLAEWNLAQTPGRAAGEAVLHASAAPPEVSPASLPGEASSGTASGAATPAGPAPIEMPAIESPRPANDNAIAPPEAPSIPPAAENQPQTAPSTPEELSPGDPRLKEQNVTDIRPKIAQREAAKQAQQAAEEAVAQNDNVEEEQVDADTGEEIQAVASGGGGGRRVRPGGGSYRRNSGSGSGRTVSTDSGTGGASGSGPVIKPEPEPAGGSSNPQSNATSLPSQPAPVAQAAEAARPVFEPDYKATPKAVAQRLKLAGLSDGEIVSFGGENASKLSPAAAKRAAHLGEHFSAGDMKALGSFLERTGLVMDNHLADTLIDAVPAGELSDVLGHIELADAYKSETGVEVEPDPDSGVNIDESQAKTKDLKSAGEQESTGEQKPPAKKEIPYWRQAELDLGPALENRFGPGWKASTRFKPKLAGKTELLGSTVPEYYREAATNSPAMAFEVKRFNLEEMGVSRDGKTIAAPSKATAEALLRAKLQLASRKWNLPQGTEQNIVFNVTGQGVTDIPAVGDALIDLLKSNSINYDHVYIQNGSELTLIGK